MVCGLLAKINIYTKPEAYQLLRIDDLVTKLAKYKYFSTFDLKSVCHQVKLKQPDKKYTAFEDKG